MSSETDQNNRLDRIETKLDSLSEAVVSLARAEEKIAVLMVNVHTQNENLIQLNRRVETLELNTDRNTSTINNINRLFWILIAAAVGTISTMILK